MNNILIKRFEEMDWDNNGEGAGAAMQLWQFSLSSHRLDGHPRTLTSNIGLLLRQVEILPGNRDEGSSRVGTAGEGAQFQWM